MKWLRLRRAYIAGVCTAAALTAACQTDKGSNVAAKADPVQTRTVRVATATQENVSRSIEVSGTLAAEEQVQLGMRVAGRLSELLVDLGSPVKRGQILARLDPTEFQLLVEEASATLQQARNRLGLAPDGNDDRVNPQTTSVVRQASATLNEARLRRDRARQLLEQKLIPPSEFDAAEAAFLVAQGRYDDAVEEIRNRQAMLRQQRSGLELAKQNLAETVLRSPIDGAVSERHTSAGQYIQAGAPIVTVVRMNPLRLRLAVPERAAANVRPGQIVNVRVEQDPNVHHGRVVRLSPTIDVASRTLLVEAAVTNESGRLRPGAFARAEMITQSAQPAVLVPSSAVTTFAGLQKVIAVENGKTVEKQVATGRRYGDRTEIAQGLAAGETVVIRPGNLVGGQQVIIER
jgi:multidrug efflux pump subunit AcrA (membrane-fusion protein)